MSPYLAIDPGISSGWCVVNGSTGKILGCGGGAKSPPPMRGDWRRALIEMPFIYPHRSNVDPNSLMVLARQVGNYQALLEGLGVKVELVFPADWKGQLLKEVMHPRILGAISTDEEKKIFLQASKGLSKKGLGDMLDAVGLAQWAFRTGRTR